MNWTTVGGALYPEGAIDRETPEINLIRLSDRAAASGRHGEAATAAAGGDSAL